MPGVQRVGPRMISPNDQKAKAAGLAKKQKAKKAADRKWFKGMVDSANAITEGLAAKRKGSLIVEGHEVEFAYYSDMPRREPARSSPFELLDPHPEMECLCGSILKGATWEDCGRAFDAHLVKEAKQCKP